MQRISGDEPIRLRNPNLKDHDKLKKLNIMGNIMHELEDLEKQENPELYLKSPSDKANKLRELNYEKHKKEQVIETDEFAKVLYLNN